jgi:integrase
MQYHLSNVSDWKGDFAYMSTQNLPIAAPIAAFTRSTSSSGVISLSGSDKVVQLLAVIASERADAPLPMLKTAAGHFATYMGVPLPDLEITTLASAMQGFGSHLAKFRRKNGKKLERNSVRSYVNYAQMLLRLAVELGWLPVPSNVEFEWRAKFDGVDWSAIKDGTRLRHACYKLMRFAVAAGVAPGKFSDEHLKAHKDLKVDNGRHPKYAKNTIQRFRLGITRAGLRGEFPKVSHSADDRCFGIAIEEMPEPMRSQLRAVIDNRVGAGTRRLPLPVTKSDGKKAFKPGEVKIRPITAKQAEESAGKVLGFTQRPEGLWLGIDLNGKVELFDALNFKVIDAFITWQLDDREMTGKSLSGLSVLCASLDMYPGYKDVDFKWFRDLIATIPEDDEEAVIDRKSEKYLPHIVLCGIPAKIEQERRHVEKGTVEYARLTHDMLLTTWMPTFAWRQRNARECSLDTSKRCKNLFKARLSEYYRNAAIPEEIQALLAEDPDAEVWQIFFSKDQVKTGQTIRGIVPLHIVPLLEEYLELRHLLIGKADPGTLFLNRGRGKHRGGALSKLAFGDLIGGLTQKYAGRWVTPHLYRDALAHHWLDEHPEDYLSLSKHLWHININTTVQRYGHKYDESFGLKKVGGWTGSFFKR